MSFGRVLFVLTFGALAALFALLCSAPAPACGPAFAYRSYAPSYTPYVERVVVEKEIVPVAVAVPVASVGYAPAAVTPAAAPASAAAAVTPAAVAAPSPCAKAEAEAADLRKRVDQLEGIIARMGAPGGAPAAENVTPPAKGAATPWQQNCAACHGKTAEKDATKGGKVFKFFGDKGQLLEAAPVNKLLLEAKRGTMPPADAASNPRKIPPLTDQQYDQMQEDLLGAK